MYDRRYWENIAFQRVCQFLRTGGEIIDFESRKGKPGERVYRYQKALTESMCLFRDRVIAFDWNSVSHDENLKQMKTEDMWQEALLATGNMNDLHYEMGFLTSIKLGQEIAQIMQDI